MLRQIMSQKLFYLYKNPNKGSRLTLVCLLINGKLISLSMASWNPTLWMWESSRIRGGGGCWTEKRTYLDPKTQIESILAGLLPITPTYIWPHCNTSSYLVNKALANANRILHPPENSLNTNENIIKTIASQFKF